MVQNNRGNGGGQAAAAGVGGAVGAFIGSQFNKPALAAPGDNFTLDEETRQAIQRIDQGLVSVNSSLVTANGSLDQLEILLGGKQQQKKMYDLFEYRNQILQPQVAFKVLDVKNGSGNLFWLIVDVGSSNVTVGLVIDSRVEWQFLLSDLVTQQIFLPMYPGAWLCKADPIGPPPQFVMLFSSGNIEGFPYYQSLYIYVRFEGAAPGTPLNQVRGVQWTPQVL